MESTNLDRATLLSSYDAVFGVGCYTEVRGVAVDTAEGGRSPTSPRDCHLARKWSFTDRPGRGDLAGCNLGDQPECTSDHRSLYLREGSVLCVAGRST